MTPYLVVVVTPLIISLFQQIIHTKNYNVGEDVRKKHYIHFLLLSGIIVFLFFSFRSQYVGNEDTRNYYNMMKKAVSSSNWNDYYDENGNEIGFQLFVFGLSRIFHDPQWLLVFSSAICIISVSYYIYHNSDDIVMSMVMYISLDLMCFQMQIMRQSIAMSICLFAFEYAKKKKPIRFFLLVLLASQIHRTSMVFAVVYFIRWLKYDIKSMVLIALGSSITLLYSGRIISYANEFFETNYTNIVSSGGFVAVAIYVLIILTAFIFNKKLKNNCNEVMIMYITIMGFVIYILRYFGTLIAERISFYFVFGQLALLPNTLKQLPERERILVKYFVYALMISLYIYRLKGIGMLPYEFFWQ